MGTQPWGTDRDLTQDSARALIEFRFPEIDAARLRHVGSGWEFDAFLTRDGWVFRFPRRSECDQLFDPEKPVHSLVAPVMPSGIAVPCVELLGQPALDFPYRFAGHRYVAGVTADAVDPVFMPVLAGDIGAALGAIHSIPENAVRAAGVAEQNPDEPGRAEWLELGFDAAFSLRGLDSVLDDGLRWLARITVPIQTFAGRFHLIHQDLGPDHLIVNPASGHLAGILDWTDSTLGDPARDFAFVVTWRGWRFAQEVLRSYPLKVDDGFTERLRFMSRLLAIMWLATAYRQSGDVSEHLGGVHHAFAS